MIMFIDFKVLSSSAVFIKSSIGLSVLSISFQIIYQMFYLPYLWHHITT